MRNAKDNTQKQDSKAFKQSFARALGWYNKAVAALEVAVENGDTWYEKALSGARAGEKRCQQEVTPC